MSLSKSSSTDTVQTVSSDLYQQDSKGYLVFVEGLLIDNKYKILKQLGKGTFSRVFECYQVNKNKNKNKNTNKFAVKVIRNLYKYQMAAKTELQVLNIIRDNDPNDISCCIHIVKDILWHSHPVFIFPLYGQSLYSFMVRNNHKPFCYRDIIALMHQLCSAIAYIHSLNIIITDIKPENIVLVNDSINVKHTNKLHRIYSYPVSTKIKLIDFGSAVLHKDDTKHKHLIQTRHYRCPEVVFRLDWSFAADLWSVGCILVELIYGRMLFNTHCSIDHLNQIVKCINAPPSSLLQRIDDETWDDLFDSRGALNMYKAKRSPVQCKRLLEYFENKDSNTQCAQLYDLCTKLLSWDNRLTAKETLKHPVFN